MAVDIRGCADITVPEPFLDLLHRNIVCEKERSTAVPEIVKANMAKAVALQNPAEIIGYRMGCENVTHWIYKYIAFIFSVVTVSADLHILFLLLFEIQKLFPEIADQRE